MDVTLRTDSRGVSTTVGYVLLLGITVAGATGVVVLGGAAISDIQRTATVANVENGMTQLDNQASQVALGSSSVQTIQIVRSEAGSLNVDDSAGRIEITHVTANGTTQIANATLGAVEYSLGDTVVAYQGGGVWRRTGNGSIMISPPSFHYRGRTLTVPIITVDGSGSVGSLLAIRQDGRDVLFPSASRSNPLSEGHVHVRITSRYHEGWKRYLETRTEGDVTHYPATDTVVVNLTVPFSVSFDYGVAATATGSSAISSNGPGGFDGPQVTGADRPSASPRVDAKISTCESGGCTDLSADLADGTLTKGTYYEDGDITVGDTTYATGSGNITVVVNGDLTITGNSRHDVTGSGTVTYYVKGDLSVSGTPEVNTGGDPTDFVVLMHSNSTSIDVSGTAQFTGLVYAPNTELSINGGGPPWKDNIVGAVVVETATSNGNGNLQYSPPPASVLQFEVGSEITYLHLTQRNVTVAPVDG